jgi:transcriptional regulator with XRE-family HTH domain
MDLVAQEVTEYVLARIREEMERQRYKHHHAAQALGVDRSAISNKLRGDRKLSTEELVALARWLNVPVAQFLPETVDVTS